MKKRILSLVLVLAMSVGMMACGSKGDDLVENTPAPTQAAGTENQGGDKTDTPEATATPVPAKKLEYAAGTVLRMATGYNNAKTGLFFDAETAGEGVTLADGKTYQSGDLKPTWVEVQNLLNVVFENKYQGNKSSDEFNYWKEQLGEVLNTLTYRERRVLSLRFGLEDGRARTLEEVGREFNVTRERIRQIEAKALRKLRHPSRSKKLKDFLES